MGSFSLCPQYRLADVFSGKDKRYFVLAVFCNELNVRVSDDHLDVDAHADLLDFLGRNLYVQYPRLLLHVATDLRSYDPTEI